MKPKNIEQKQTERKRSALRGVVLFTLLQLLCGAGLGAAALLAGLPAWLKVLFAVLAGLDLLSIPPALLVLKERWNEIEGGELDAAGKY